MSLSAFVPKGTTVYTGLKLPAQIIENALIDDLNSLLGPGNWRIEQTPRTYLAEHEAPLAVVLDQPWGESRAQPGDYILRGPHGVSVVPVASFWGLKLTEIKE